MNSYVEAKIELSPQVVQAIPLVEAPERVVNHQSILFQVVMAADSL